MPNHPKYRKLKRPTVVVKRNLKRRPKKANSHIYENLKTNNKALARALSKQKEQTQQLTLENLELTRQLNETNHQTRRHVEAFSIILKNSREAMNLMVKATEQVVSAISTCNTLLHPEGPGNPVRPLVTRDANRRVSTKSPNKSPARGVVQPMVSGHAIAQPAIALSRIRIVSMPPNVSDIEETAESPGTPVRSVSRMSASHNRPLNRGGIPPMMPQRIRVSSPRDESLSDDRRLSNISRRSSRYQKRKSRTSRHSDLELRDSISHIETTMRTPRVSLEDVSRLMQNSHSINVRSLMDTEEASGFLSSLEGDGSLPREEFTVPTPPSANGSPEVSLGTAESSESPTSSPLSRPSSPTYQVDHRGIKERKRRRAEKAKMEKAAKIKKGVLGRLSQELPEDDPLEGTSWRYSNGIAGNDSGNGDESNDQSREIRNETNATSLDNSEGSRMDVTPSRMFDGSLRGSARLSITNRMSLTMVNSRNGWEEEDEDEDEDDDDDDDDRCQVIDIGQRRNSDEGTTSFPASFSRNVCTSRGRVEEFDPDEFTMMRRPNKPFKPCNMEELEIPDIPPHELERPLITAPEAMAPEPEITKTIQIQGAYQQVGMQIPPSGDLLSNVTFNTSVMMPVIDTAGRESDEDTMVVPKGRRRNGAPVPIVESSSESETSTPPRKNNKRGSRAKGSKRRDPSSAKVVLEKLKEPQQRKRPGSPRPSSVNGYLNRTSNSLTSDSESSNASFGSNPRPRRQRAPVNFAEPSLRKKLRRE